MATELVKQFEALWESGDAPPDVFAFLEQQNGSATDDILSVLLQDQQRRWNTDNPLKVEDYLDKLPELASDHDSKLQLVVGEFQARQNGEASPSVNEFASRFPDIEETLRSQLTKLGSDGNADEVKVTTTQTVTSDWTIGERRIGRYQAGKRDVSYGFRPARTLPDY